MTMAVGPISRLWTWLACPAARDRRARSRAALESARQALVRSQYRARNANLVADWMASRSRENHIAGGVRRLLDTPRKDAP